jgi:hypothetical protein
LEGSTATILMPPKEQPRPDPVSLEAIFHYLTTSGVSLDSRAYHLVALNTVAFQSDVKTRISERPDVIKAIAMFLVQRDRAAFECRWETLGLIGELCRREAREDLPDGQKASVVNAAATKCAAAFVDIPWFRSALSDVAAEDGDKDVPVVVKDLLAALPETNEGWHKACRDRCVDLMFLDATTQFLPLIPLVTRSDPLACAQCKKSSLPTQAAGSAFATPYLRCSSCKAVYYCSQECQVAHWKIAHRVPCQSYKARVADTEKTSGGTSVALEPSLFFETRRFIYDHRGESLSSIDYESFFMKYATNVA